MEWLTVAVIIVAVMWFFMSRRNGAENAPKTRFEKRRPDCREGCQSEREQRAASREAHYMQNFWSYDGSEQQDWDEEA